MNPGRTAAPVLQAMWARPVAVQACDAEERHKLALRRGHVRVHQNADRAAGVDGCQQPAAEVVFVNHEVAVEAADAVDLGVEAAVVEPANDHAHGMAHERVVEAGELPCAEVPGDDEDALAAGLRRQVVIEAFGAHPVAGVLGGVARHAAELDELPAQMNVDVLENFFPGLGGEFGERQLEIAHADAAQAAEAPVDGKGEAGRPAGAPAARHAAQTAGYGPNQPVLQSFLH